MSEIFIIQVTAVLYNRYYNIGGSIYQDENEWHVNWENIPACENSDFKTLKSKTDMFMVVDKMQFSGCIKDSKIIDVSVAIKLLGVEDILPIFEQAKKEKKYSIGNTKERNKILNKK